MNNQKEIQRANAIATAIADYAFLGSRHPSEQGAIVNRGKLAAKALLELQGIANPTDKEATLVLAGL